MEYLYENDYVTISRDGRGTVWLNITGTTGSGDSASLNTPDGLMRFVDELRAVSRDTEWAAEWLEKGGLRQ